MNLPDHFEDVFVTTCGRTWGHFTSAVAFTLNGTTTMTDKEQKGQKTKPNEYEGVVSVNSLFLSTGVKDGEAGARLCYQRLAVRPAARGIALCAPVTLPTYASAKVSRLYGTRSRL